MNFNLILAITLLISACSRSGEPAASSPVVNTPIVAPPITDTVYVGDGNSNLTISGNYKPGTLIIVRPGIYNKGGGITLEQLNNVTVQLTGVILDGLSQTKDGFYNVLSLNKLNNVLVVGGTTQNNGYRMMYISGQCKNVIFSSHNFINNNEGVFFNAGIKWDGTDATVGLQNFAIRNCNFINCGNSIIGTSMDQATSTVFDLVKNFEISGCKWKGGNPGTAMYFPAVDSAMVFNNTIDSVNMNLTNDNRIFLFIGTAEFYNNTANIYQGHVAGLWSVSFGTKPKTSHFYKNTCNGSLKYSAFEFQEFAIYKIPGKTTYGDLEVVGNTCTNLNTQNHTGFDANFIDNYEYGIMGGKVSVKDNIGRNFYAPPAPGVFWNLAKPSVVSGNIYQQ